MELALILSRIQYGLSLGTHFIFPPTTLGLTLFIFLAETFYLKTHKEVYKNLSSFAVRILTLVFALGVATGLTLPFTLGTNWAEFSKIAGAVFGVQLAVEAVVAFTLESVFIGVLFFARNKVSPKIYWLATLLVFLGSHFSAFIIIAANSWMQTPAGITFDPATGKIIMESWIAVNLNPTTILRFLHTVTGAWLVGTFLLVGIAAWFIKKEKDLSAAKIMMTMAGVIALITALAQPVLGHASIVAVRDHQPVKAAALEGIYNDERGASLHAFGIVDEKKGEVYGFGIPGMLSFLYDWDFNSEVKGLNSLAPNKADRPPVQAVFQTFHLMVLAGVAVLVALAFAMLFHWKNTLQPKKKFLTLLLCLTPLPYIAVETGWITAEVGRQPWTIFPLPSVGFPGLRTSHAVTSGLIPEYVWFSLIFFSLVYIVVFVVFFRFLPGLVKQGITPREIKG